MKIIRKININFLTYLSLLIFIFSGYKNELIYILTIFIIHELGHLFFIMLFKIKVKSITIYPFGGVIKIYERINEKFYKAFLVSFGGILFQLCLFILNKLYINNHLLNHYNNYFLLINIIPVIPFDGSKVLLVLLSHLFKYQVARKIYIIVSALVLTLVIHYEFITKNYNLMLVSFLIISLIEELKKSSLYLKKYLLEKELSRLIN